MRLPIPTLLLLFSSLTALAFPSSSSGPLSSADEVETIESKDYSNRVLLIRHGEKKGREVGLSKMGKQRAQCLRKFMGKKSKHNIGMILAESYNPRTQMRIRPYLTVKPLADDLGLTVDVSCERDDYECVRRRVKEFARKSNKDVLVCWKHSELARVAHALGPNSKKPYKPYPDDRFDIMWVLENQKMVSKESELCKGIDDTHARKKHDPDLEVEGVEMTGASSGLGRSLVEQVLKSGERVVATLRTPSALHSLVSLYPASQLLVLPLDVTIESQVVAAFEKVKEEWGRIDVVVNNAGYGLQAEFESTGEEEARRQVEVLFWGAVAVMRQALPFFREVNPPGVRARILNISSAGGFQGSTVLPFYSAGKFALEGFTESLNRELDPAWNIKAIIIEPGGFRTSWAGTGMVELPAHPAYASPLSLASKVRVLRRTLTFPGDPIKAALAMIAISKVPDPPVRLPLGSDAVAVVRAKLGDVEKELTKWEELSLSTAADDAEDTVAKLREHGIGGKAEE
ncbi:NAD(P)-binding protein [Pseudohyphozyma bogoriensis]|nr:NAD(P)-binding protein [Pseudohyphozyma bogoriensis]